MNSSSASVSERSITDLDSNWKQHPLDFPGGREPQRDLAHRRPGAGKLPVTFRPDTRVTSPGEKKTALRERVETMKEVAQVRDSIHRSLWQHGFLLLTLGLSLVLLPAAQAVSPPPDGGYANQNTAEGDNALLNLTDGTDNTAA